MYYQNVVTAVLKNVSRVLG